MGEDAHARISHRQRVAIYRNATRLAKRSDIGLLAGARQRISDYGIYGYAMVSSPTFGEALQFSLDHVTMAGPAVRQISFRIEDGDIAILQPGKTLKVLGEMNMGSSVYSTPVAVGNTIFVTSRNQLFALGNK